MATYTSNLNLKKPSSADYVNIADINGNMDILDKAVLIDNAQTISGEKTFVSPLKAGHRAYSSASNDDVLVKSHVAELPVVHLTGNENVAGNKNLTGLTTLTMSRPVATGGSGYTILYRFKNSHAQTLLFTGGRTIVMAQVSLNGGFKGQLFTSGRDYKTTHWLWVTTDANTSNKYLVCKGLYSATMNMYVLNSFQYGSIYPFQDDIEVVNTTTDDPTTDSRWSNVTEVANYD